MSISPDFWMTYLLQNIDVGLIIVDRDYRVSACNAFVQNHRGINTDQIQDRLLFEVFPELPRQWFTRKLDTVFLLDNRAFTVWEQRPHLFRFASYRPVTGESRLMFQNLSLIPLKSLTGEVEQVGIVVYDVTELATSRQHLDKANSRLAELSRSDSLTGLYNRRHWQERLDEELLRLRRRPSPMSLLMFDLDHFKRVNDEHGHQAGDQVLRKVGELVRATLRRTDVAGRYGGEEFAVLLPETDLEGALLVAERLREAAETTPVATAENHIRFTISAGVAEWHPDIDSSEALVAAADRALYEAKHGGRNRVCTARTPSLAVAAS